MFSAIRFVGVITLILGTIIFVGLEAKAQQPQAPAMNSMVLNVKNMCCAKESVPAIKELSKLAGVKRVSCDFKTKNVKIEYTDATPSLKAIWEAAERIKIEPIRLATLQGVYTAKPVN